MSGLGPKQQEVTIISLLEAMETRMMERLDDLKREMVAMTNTHADIRQLKYNLEYIFGSDGTYTQTVKDVKRHNKYEIVTNAIVALGLLIGGSTLVQGAKRLLGIGQAIGVK